VVSWQEAAGGESQEDFHLLFCAHAGRAFLKASTHLRDGPALEL